MIKLIRGDFFIRYHTYGYFFAGAKLAVSNLSKKDRYARPPISLTDGMFCLIIFAPSCDRNQSICAFYE
jgi:hypothetical protein